MRPGVRGGLLRAALCAAGVAVVAGLPLRHASGGEARQADSDQPRLVLFELHSGG
jgi:hypothetical protein